MKILMVNSIAADVWGGGEKWYVEAAAWFTEHGHPATLVGRPGARMLAAAAARGVAVREFGFGGDYDPFATLRALATLWRSGADAVLVNFNKEAWLFGRAASLLRRPLVVRHGLTVLRPKVVHRLLVRAHVSRMVVNARSIRDHYRSLGFDTRRIEVICNGIRPVALQPAGSLHDRLGVPRSTPLVVTAGRMDGQKRLDRFVEIARRLAPAHPDLRFAIFGEGNEREDLLGRIAATGLEERFSVPGFLPDLAELIGDAELFLLTSNNEGTPNILLETMAAGTACLSFDVGAVPEILEGELSGAVLPEGDVAAMADRASRLLADRDALDGLARAQRERVRSDFDLDRSMERYLRVIRGACG